MKAEAFFAHLISTIIVGVIALSVFKEQGLLPFLVGSLSVWIYFSFESIQ